MENQSVATKPKPKSIPLFDVQIVLSARMNQTVLRGVQRGVAEWKKKQLIASGTLKRFVWIVKHASDPKTIKKK